VASARDAGAASPATFYRELRDLRCWLRALGVRPVATASTRTTARPGGGVMDAPRTNRPSLDLSRIMQALQQEVE